MSKIYDTIKNEPALVLGAVQAVLVLVMSFGIPLSDEQRAAILMVTAAFLGLITRQMVTPNAKLSAPDTKRSS